MALTASRFRLRISAEEFKRYYRGTGKYVVTQDYQGRRIRFPAGLMLRFLTHDGIRGEFVIYYDENNKFREIKKIA